MRASRRLPDWQGTRLSAKVSAPSALRFGPAWLYTESPPWKKIVINLPRREGPWPVFSDYIGRHAGHTSEALGLAGRWNMRTKRLFLAIAGLLLGGVVTTEAQAGPLSFVRSIGSSGSGDGQFDVPQDVAVDSSGNVWVSDFGNNRVEEFAETAVPEPSSTVLIGSLLACVVGCRCLRALLKRAASPA